MRRRRGIDYLQTLPSGLRLAWDDQGSLGTTAIGLFVGVGSRAETVASNWGAAHFLEHLVFKGAGTLDGAAIARAMDDLGGEINAYTTREHTVFYAKVLASRAWDAWQLLRTMVFYPRLATADVEKERQVIIAERHEALDDPEDRCEQAYMKSLYADADLVHDILGTGRSIRALSTARLKRFYRQWYRPAGMCVALSGQGAAALADRIREQEMVPARPEVAAVGEPVTVPPIPVPRELLLRADGEQVHTMVGTAAPPLDDPNYEATQLAATILGGQNSSRLWQQLREEAGLVYTVYAAYSAHSQWGDLSIYLAVHPRSLTEALRLAGNTLRTFLTQGPSPQEIERARVLITTALAFSLETPEGRMVRLGRWGLANAPPPSLADVRQRLEAVGPQDVQSVAKQLWTDPGEVALAAVGPIPRRIAPLRSYFFSPSWES